jgi:hypothetical protein
MIHKSGRDTGTREQYRGYLLIVRRWDSNVQGLAHRSGMPKIPASGVNESEVTRKLKLAIDAHWLDHAADYRIQIEKSHAERMKEINGVNKGVRISQVVRRHSNCYNCKAPVDNRFDLECVACGWIICAMCGSCGCGFSRPSR